LVAGQYVAPHKSTHHGFATIRAQNKAPAHARALFNIAEVSRYRVKSRWPAELIFRHNPLDILCLASDAVADAPIRLDRHARNDGVNVGADVVGTALRPLLLMTDIVIL
jgi:hypothetical protein